MQNVQFDKRLPSNCISCNHVEFLWDVWQHPELHNLIFTIWSKKRANFFQRQMQLSQFNLRFLLVTSQPYRARTRTAPHLQSRRIFANFVPRKQKQLNPYGRRIFCFSSALSEIRAFFTCVRFPWRRWMRAYEPPFSPALSRFKNGQPLDCNLNISSKLGRIWAFSGQFGIIWIFSTSGWPTSRRKINSKCWSNYKIAFS